MAENTKIIISAVDKTKKGFGSVTSRLKKVTGAVFSMRTALVGVAGAAGFGLLVKSSLNSTDSLAKTASKIGTTTEALGGLRFAAELTGVATNTMDMALQRFTRRTAEAAMGTGEAKGAIKELGINAQELNKMPLDKRMVVLADAFSEVKNESDRLRLAFKLFDSEGAALVNTLSGGSEALKEMLGEAKMLGLAMSSSAAKGVEDTVDAMTKLKSMAKGLTDQFVAALAPAIQSLTESITKFFAEIAKDEGGVEKWAQGLAKGFLESIANILRALDVGLTAIGGFVNKANGFLNKFDVKSQENKVKGLSDEIHTLGQEVVALRNGGDRSLTDILLGKDLESKTLELENLMFEAILARQKLQEMNAPIIGDGLSGFFDKTIAKILELKETIGGADGKGNIFSSTEEGATNVQKAFKAWQATVKDGDEIVQAFTTQGLNGLTDALTAGITGAADFADAMKAMAKSVIDSLIKMLIQKYIVDAAFGFITGAIGGGGNANASGNAAGTNLGGSMSFDGGGYTGNGSRSGGLDHKGGFMAMLHPRETVVDHTKNTNNLSKTAEQVQSFQDSSNERFKSLGRGGFSETIEKKDVRSIHSNNLNETVESKDVRSVHSNNLNEFIENKDLRSFDGGGFTGRGSRSAGVDGKGGFHAILHPNETVTDHTKSINKKRNERENTNEENNSIVVNQTINVTTGVQQTVRAEIVQLMPQIAQAAKGAVADARLRGGNFSKAMGGA